MKIAALLLSFCVLALCIPTAHADSVTYKGVTFPQGDISFADKVISYTPGTQFTPPGAPFTTPDQALGPPDAVSASQSPPGYVSLGFKGVLELQFIDNYLTGSGNSNPDLWIFEVGTGIEGQDIEISTDGVSWFSVGE